MKMYGKKIIGRQVVIVTLLKMVTAASFLPVESSCSNKAADVVFALDSSSSIWEDDFIKELDFVKNVVDHIPVGEDQIHVGLVTFATKVETQFRLNDYFTSQEIATALTNVKYHNGSTNTGDAIKHARETMFNSKDNRHRGNVNKITVVVTDGYSFNTTNTSLEASISRSHGIKLFSVGIGRYLDGLELNAIANKPNKEVEKFVFRVDDFDALKTIEAVLAQTICTAIKTTPANSFQDTDIQGKHTDTDVKHYCGGKPADVFFVLDSSTSIGALNFRKMLNFVSDVVDMFDIGPAATRVGVVTYSSSVSPDATITNRMSKPALQQHIRHIRYARGGTNTGLALGYVRRSFNQQFSRQDVARVVIIVTDGQSADTSLTQEESSRLHTIGVNIFGIGIGDVVDKVELKNIASEPEENFVFEMDDFDALSSVKNTLAIKTCMAADTDNTGMQKDHGITTCRAVEPTDAIFVFDKQSIGNKKSDLLLETLVDVMSEINSVDIQSGIMMDSCENLQEIPLSSYREKQDILFTSTTSQSRGLPILIRKLRTFGFNAQNGGRDGVRQAAFLIIDGRLEEPHQAILESKRLRFGEKIEVYTIVIGDSLDGEATQMVGDPVEEHIISIADFSDMPNMKMKILERLCLSHINVS